MRGASVHRLHFNAVLLLIAGLLAVHVHAYTPAQPSNLTLGNGTGAAGSSLALFWFPNGFLNVMVDYQLAATNSTGLTTGPLVLFQEDGLTNDTTTTPWIALISCDKKDNNTQFLPDTDIFTLAQERGAVSALLYSNTSQTCLINEDYLNETAFDRLIDVFSVNALVLTQTTFYDYQKLPNMSEYTHFNATQLNASQAIVNHSIEAQFSSRPSFMYARLASFNTTGSTNSSGGPPGGGHRPSGHSPSTGLAMIVLYSITGVVSALFCVVIVTGVIRAIRHPERYTGREAFGRGGPNTPHSRRTVITRAILDTFPVIKFYRAPGTTNDVADDVHAKKDVESRGNDPDLIKMREVVGEGRGEETEELGGETPLWLAPLVHRSDEDLNLDLPASRHFNNGHADERQASTSSDVRSTPTSPTRLQSQATAGSSAAAGDPLMPDAIGHDTCPICIVDFEVGDDLRVLPCEGKHSFHQQCVDPWLLELSGSCPLCRQDFATLETMMEGTPDDPSARRGSAAPSVVLQQGPPRRSHYIRFAQRRRTRNRRDRASSSLAPTAETPSVPPVPHPAHAPASSPAP